MLYYFLLEMWEALICELLQFCDPLTLEKLSYTLTPTTQQLTYSTQFRQHFHMYCPIKLVSRAVLLTLKTKGLELRNK